MSEWLTRTGEGWALRDDPAEHGPVLVLQEGVEVKLTADQATAIDGVERQSVFDKAFQVFPQLRGVSMELLSKRIVQVLVDDCECPQALKVWTEAKDGVPGRVLTVTARAQHEAEPATVLVFEVEEWPPGG